MAGKFTFRCVHSQRVTSLICELLCPDLALRLKSAAVLKAHPWFAGLDWAEALARDLTPPFRPAVHKVATPGRSRRGRSPRRSSPDRDNCDLHFTGFTYVADLDGPLHDCECLDGGHSPRNLLHRSPCGPVSGAGHGRHVVPPLALPSAARSSLSWPVEEEDSGLPGEEDGGCPSNGSSTDSFPPAVDAVRRGLEEKGPC
jgi:hypothetical protein